MKNENTNIYVIFKFTTHEHVAKRLDFIKENNKNIVFFNFYDVKDRFWKRKAREKIRNCAFVLFFYDNYAIAEKQSAKNIKYELDLVREYKKKLITVYTSSEQEVIDVSNAILAGNIDALQSDRSKIMNSEVAKMLFGTDFSEQSVSGESFRPMNLVDCKDRVMEYAEWSVENSIQNDENFSEKTSRDEYYKLLIKQYELMIETSETLIKRRTEMSDKYRNTCIALISLVASSIALGNMLLTGIGAIIAGVICTFVSFQWKASLIEFSRNNEGKYAVINAIEKKLPVNMFDTEYTYNTFRGIRTYSVREMSFPKTFTIIGICLLILGAVVFGFAIWQFAANHTFNLYDILKINTGAESSNEYSSNRS